MKRQVDRLSPGGPKALVPEYRAPDGERWTGGAIPNDVGRQANKLKILVVDQNTLSRAGLQYLLKSVRDLKVVREAGNSAVALEKVKALNPDVVLIELSLEPLDGVEVTRRILATKGVHTRAEAITYALEHKMMGSSLFSSNGGSEPISVSARDAQSAAHV